MVTGIGFIIGLAAAGPTAAPTRVVTLAIAQDPVLVHARLIRPHPVVIFNAPQSPVDLRHFRAGDPARVANVSPVLPRIAAEATVPESEPYRFDRLIARDEEAEFTGRRAAHPSMAAGLSLRMVNAGGVLASEIGMSGAVGRALTRVALEAIDHY